MESFTNISEDSQVSRKEVSQQLHRDEPNARSSAICFSGDYKEKSGILSPYHIPTFSSHLLCKPAVGIKAVLPEATAQEHMFWELPIFLALPMGIYICVASKFTLQMQLHTTSVSICTHTLKVKK